MKCFEYLIQSLKNKRMKLKDVSHGSKHDGDVSSTPHLQHCRKWPGYRKRMTAQSIPTLLECTPNETHI